MTRFSYRFLTTSSFKLMFASQYFKPFIRFEQTTKSKSLKVRKSLNWDNFLWAIILMSEWNEKWHFTDVIASSWIWKLYATYIACANGKSAPINYFSDIIQQKAGKVFAWKLIKTFPLSLSQQTSQIFERKLFRVFPFAWEFWMFNQNKNIFPVHCMSASEIRRSHAQTQTFTYLCHKFRFLLFLNSI